MSHFSGACSATWALLAGMKEILNWKIKLNAHFGFLPCSYILWKMEENCKEKE